MFAHKGSRRAAGWRQYKPSGGVPSRRVMIVAVQIRPITFRFDIVVRLCVVFLALVAFLAAHAMVGLAQAPSAGAEAASEVSTLPSQGCQDDGSHGGDGTERHGPGDTECGISARDVSPFLDLIACSPEFEARPAFARPGEDDSGQFIGARQLPFPPSGRQILASSCTSRT